MQLFRNLSERGVGPFPGMPDTAEVLSYGEVGEPPVGSWTVDLTTKCRVSPLTVRESAQLGQLSATVNATAFVPWNTEIGSNSRLRITDGQTGEVKTYEVAGVPDASARLSADKQVFLGRRA